MSAAWTGSGMSQNIEPPPVKAMSLRCTPSQSIAAPAQVREVLSALTSSLGSSIWYGTYSGGRVDVTSTLYGASAVVSPMTTSSRLAGGVYMPASARPATQPRPALSPPPWDTGHSLLGTSGISASG